MSKQPPRELDGPHRLPYGEQERCAVEGNRIDGSGQCNMVAIRDRKRHGWVLYPHRVANFGVLIADDAAYILAHCIGGPSEGTAIDRTVPTTPPLRVGAS